MVTQIDSSVLLSFYQSKTGQQPTAAASTALTKRVAPTAPWNGATTTADTSAALKAVLTARSS